MTDNILIFMLPLVLIKTMLMMSLLPKKRYIFIFGGICVLFTFLMHPFALEQNKLSIEQSISSQKMLTDLSIIVMVDLLLTLAFCQSLLMKIAGSVRKKMVIMMGYLPSVLIFPALYYLHLNTFFLFPGNNFILLTILFAGVIFLLLTGGSLLFRKYLPEAEFRTELTLLISFLLFLLTVCFTVFHPSAMVYTHSQVLNWKEPLLTFSLVGILFIAGYIINMIIMKRKTK